MDISKENNTRDYNQISPSARSLVLLKGLTNIPFAKETAELISQPDKYNPDFNNKDMAFWKRVVHFESRYWSIDQLLSPLTITNILELSSGYSFRGLDTVTKKRVQYIDTDLLNVITEKKQLMVALQVDDTNSIGVLKMLPLNALDEKQFVEIVKLFPEGPIVIVNEGLLMYLNNTEKENLCKIIYQILKDRGGFWITGDIYIKTTLERFRDQEDDSLKELIEQQRIEDNMFESFHAAEDFFRRSGFVIDKEAEVALPTISSLKYLVNNATESQLAEMQAHPKKIQATWRLKIESYS
jgi:O-methyltransferase involved in polyketide biosynthesis